jgi:opacity protein-like surface antigen
MKRCIAVVLAFVGIMGTSQAFAQEAGPGPGKVELSIIPGGALFFTEEKDANEPSFGNYDLGAALAVNFNRYIGIEGEVSGALGIEQGLDSAGFSSDVKTPNLVNYSGNLVVSAANRSPVVPYLTGGVGGLTLLETAALGINQAETFLTGNVGGGVKWFAGRWGLRADYRFIGVQSKDDAPAFFGRETRYGHRVYASVIVNLVQ